MDPRRQYLEEQLQRKESEASELRRNLRDLGTKFHQLERAFEINLQSQVNLEVELNRVKLESEGRLRQKYFFFFSLRLPEEFFSRRIIIPLSLSLSRCIVKLTD